MTHNYVARRVLLITLVRKPEYSGRERVNTMVANALAPSVARSSAAMV